MKLPLARPDDETDRTSFRGLIDLAEDVSFRSLK